MYNECIISIIDEELVKNVIRRNEENCLNFQEMPGTTDVLRNIIIPQCGWPVMPVLYDETNSADRKTWQQLVMEEHMEYYNEKHETSYTFEEYYDAVVNKQIDVHYDWQKLLGIME